MRNTFKIGLATEPPKTGELPFYHRNVRMKVFGVGGAGCNTINRMIENKLEAVEYYAVNTDANSLRDSVSPNRILIGRELTQSLGTGSFPELGEKAVMENEDEIKKCLDGADIAFINCGLGGGTGTGAAPVIAEWAKEKDILTIGIASLPWELEGSKRLDNALVGLEKLRTNVDTIIIIENENIYKNLDESITQIEALYLADMAQLEATKGISNLIAITGLINVDFADVKAILKNGGNAHMGNGSATGKDAGLVAAKLALSNPLMGSVDISGAKGILLNVSGSESMKMWDIKAAAAYVREKAGLEAKVIFGTVTDKSMMESLSVTVIAAGFKRDMNFHNEVNVKSENEAVEEASQTVRTIAPRPDGPRRDAPVEDMEDPALLRKAKENSSSSTNGHRNGNGNGNYKHVGVGDDNNILFDDFKNFNPPFNKRGYNK